jgi:amidase
MAQDLHWLTLTDLAARIAAREVSPIDATQAMLDRIERLDPSLHAYFTVLPERAMAQATRAVAEIAAGRIRGPLHGVPIAIKDLYDLEGVPTTAGTTVLRDRVAASSCTVVERLEAAGAIVLGKLALTEGAMIVHHPTVTPPINPWNADRWTGASSSGSGVATAAGLCFASLGSDTGGSIRFPSAACGIVGIKPTWGRVSRAGVFPLAASLDHVGPMTRSVADAAVVLGVIAGADPRDPTALQEPVPNYMAAPERSVRGLRIGVDERWVTGGMDPEVTGLVLATTDVFRSLGAHIVPVNMPSTDAVAMTWYIICTTEAAISHTSLYPEHADDYGPAFRGLLDAGRGLPATVYAGAHEARLRFAGELAGVFQGVDLILSPSLGLPTPTIPFDASDQETTGLALRFTAPFDLSGSPTISVPCGFTADGMPASLQLVARHLDEETLVAAGYAYECSTEWHLRRPPLAT